MAHSPDEMRLVLKQVQLDPEARRLIDRIFDYTHRVARHVMTLRRDVVTLTGGKTFEENVVTALQNQYTRYPLVEPSTDRVIGYVHIKDILAALARDQKPVKMREIAREPIYAGEDTPLEELRRKFQRRRTHLAVILDGSANFVGIVTLEDLIEEFVGEIQDEQDVEEVAPIVRRADGTWEVDGRVTLDVGQRELGVVFSDLPEGIETLGGFVAERLGEVPVPGDAIEAEGLRFQVTDVLDGRVRRLRVERTSVAPGGGA